MCAVIYTGFKTDGLPRTPVNLLRAAGLGTLLTLLLIIATIMAMPDPLSRTNIVFAIAVVVMSIMSESSLALCYFHREIFTRRRRRQLAAAIFAITLTMVVVRWDLFYSISNLNRH